MVAGACVTANESVEPWQTGPLEDTTGEAGALFTDTAIVAVAEQFVFAAVNV